MTTKINERRAETGVDPRVGRTADLGHGLGRFLVDRDLEGCRGLMADGMTIHSPFLAAHGFVFDGIDESCNALLVLINEADDFVVTDEYASADAFTMVFTATFRGRPVHGVMLGRVDADGRLRNIDVMIRGFVGLAMFGRAFGAAFIRARNRPMSWIPILMLSTAVGLTRVIDGLGSLLVKFSLRKTAPRVMTVPRRPRAPR